MQPIPLLKTLGFSFIALGLFFAIAPATPAVSLVDLFFDLAYFPIDDAQMVTTPSEALSLAIAGGLSAGLGTAMVLLSRGLALTHPRACARLLIGIVTAWYIPDSLGSWLAGAWFNVVMNTGFFALVLWAAVLLRAAEMVDSTPSEQSTHPAQ